MARVEVVAPGARGERSDVGARARLGHGKRADPFARDELGQIFFLLRFAAVPRDLVDTQIGMRAVGKAHRGRSAADLLHRDDVRRVTHPGTAVLFFDGDAEQAQGAHLFPQVHRKLIGAVDLGRARGDLGGGKAAHCGTQHVDLLAEPETQSGQLDRRDCAGGEVLDAIHGGLRS